MAVNFLLKRSSTASKRPTAAQLDVGELSLNYDANTAGVFFEDGSGNVRKVGPTEVGTTAPNATPAGSAGNSRGEMWLDTSSTPNVLKTWNGSSWIAAGTGSYTESASAPSSPTVGDQWLDTDTTTLYTYINDASGAQWVELGGTAVSVAGGGDVIAASNNTFTGANSFFNSTGQTFSTATASNDGIILNGRAGGTSSYRVSLIPDTLSASRTLTLPNIDGTVVTTGDTGSVTSTMILNGTILDADVNASAAIAGTKISPSFGAQLIQCSQNNQALSLTGNLNAANTTNGLLSVGTLGFSGARMGANFTSSQTSYYQVVLQNTSSNAGASTDFVVCNDASTDSTIYGNFGINSSTYTGSGSLQLPSAVYVTATTGDLVLGTTTSNQVRFVINNGTTDAMGINTSGALLLNGSTGTSGQVLQSNGSAAAPTWVTPTNTWVTIEKTSNESRTATTTLTADGALQFSMAANTNYTIRIYVYFDTTAAADFKFGFTGPTIGAGLIRMQRSSIAAGGASFGTISVATAYDTTGVAVTGTGTNGGYVQLNGIVQNGVNAGTFQFTWAQNTSDAGNTIVRAGSYLEYNVA